MAHGDFDTSHIFAANGSYTGIIDFGEIRGAEPTFDLGHLALHAPDALPAVLQGYASVTRSHRTCRVRSPPPPSASAGFALPKRAPARIPLRRMLVEGMTRICALSWL